MSNETMTRDLRAQKHPDKVIEYVRRWGEANSDGILDKTCHIFAIASIPGLIGYRKDSKNTVVLGDPVCAPENKGLLAKAFQNYCKEQNLKVVYTIVSEDFANWAAENLSAALIEFADRIILDPFDNPMKKTGPKAILLRKKVKRAIKDGVAVIEYKGHDAELEQNIELIGTNWLKARKGPQVYLSPLSIFNDREGKRWFYAKWEGHVVGLLVLNEISSSKGWLLNNLMLTADAPVGTSELLVISVLEQLEKEECRFLVAGPTPTKELGKMTGMGGVIKTLTCWVYRNAAKVFNLNGQAIFWEKFQPKVESSYLLFPEKNLNLFSVKAIFQAYHAGML